MVADCTDEEFERILAINLKSVFYGCQAAIRHMIPQGSGNIVNISSGAIDTPAPTLACYGMTKAAVAMLTKTLATEVGRHGIRVNAIAPGMILTNFSRHNFVDEQGNVVPEKLEQYHKRAGALSPLGRSGEAEDVARVRSSISCPTPRRSSPGRSSAPTAASRCPGNGCDSGYRCGAAGRSDGRLPPRGARRSSSGMSMCESRDAHLRVDAAARCAVPCGSGRRRRAGCRCASPWRGRAGGRADARVDASPRGGAARTRSPARGRGVGAAGGS